MGVERNEGFVDERFVCVFYLLEGWVGGKKG